jgi:hypothetical protein
MHSLKFDDIQIDASCFDNAVKLGYNEFGY